MLEAVNLPRKQFDEAVCEGAPIPGALVRVTDLCVLEGVTTVEIRGDAMSSGADFDGEGKEDSLPCAWAWRGPFASQEPELPSADLQLSAS